MSVAWDNFIAAVDPVELERERMRAVDLKAERFGSREHHEAVWLHEVRRGESLRARAAVVSPVWFTAKQLQIAEDALRGPVGGFGGRVASPAHENTSTEVNPATGHVASNEETNERRAA